MAGSASLARHAQIAGIDKADELLRFPVEFCVRTLGVVRIRCVPDFRETRANVRTVHRHDVERVVLALVLGVFRFIHLDVATVTIGATEHHAWVGVHRVSIRTGVTGHTTRRLLVGIGHRLAFRGRRMARVLDVLRLLAFGRERGTRDG